MPDLCSTDHTFFTFLVNFCFCTWLLSLSLISWWWSTSKLNEIKENKTKRRCCWHWWWFITLPHFRRRRRRRRRFCCSFFTRARKSEIRWKKENENKSRAIEIFLTYRFDLSSACCFEQKWEIFNILTSDRWKQIKEFFFSFLFLLLQNAQNLNLNLCKSWQTLAEKLIESAGGLFTKELPRWKARHLLLALLFFSAAVAAEFIEFKDEAERKVKEFSPF